ncbi:MAG: hypothetical protein Q8P18_31440, partial [Pseudomonadota bacterium]|nr:hypothetical protein [Pseudomonadota bacterium]
TVGAPYSPRAGAHGALLRRMMAAELHLRELDRDPAAHLPVLRSLLAEAEEERKLDSALALRAFADRIERRIGAAGQNCSAARPCG